MRKTVAEIEREYGVTPIESAVAAWYRDNLDVWGDRGVSITVREFVALLAMRDELLALERLHAAGWYVDTDARLDWECSECAATIAPGEPIYNLMVDTWQYCKPCGEAMIAARTQAAEAVGEVTG